MKGEARVLGIVIATVNRREALRAVLDSIEHTTRTAHTVVVVDGGSTDGTIDLLHERDIQVVVQGRLTGVARACNAGFARLGTEYACWLSDDTEILEGALDTAVAILDRDPTIGMVGLKMSEASRPEKGYAGAVSELGILNCNHGVLRLDLLRSVGMFHEGYRSYMIDPDLTAAVLAAGRAVVMTRRHAVLHHRGEPVNAEERELLDRLDDPARMLYRKRFGWVAEARERPARRVLRPIVSLAVRALLVGCGSRDTRLGLGRRDQHVLRNARWISPLDPLLRAGRAYHLEQRLPTLVLRDTRNPVRLSRSS